MCISLEGVDNVPESGSSQHPTHRHLCAPAVLCSGFSLSHSLTQTPTGFGDQARVPQSVALRDLICVMWLFPPLSSSGRRCVQLMAEAPGEVSIKRRNPFSFLGVCCFSLFLMPVFSPPGYRYCLQHPPRWNQTRGFSRPCTWSVCCFLCHILCPAVQAYVCLLVFVEVPWHYNFKEIQRMEVISPTSWMNTERNQDEKGVLQSHALLLWGYRQKINLEGIIRSALQRYKGQQRCKHHIFFSSRPPQVLK